MDFPYLQIYNSINIWNVFTFLILKGLPSHRNTADSNDNNLKFMSTNKEVITFMCFLVYTIPRGMDQAAFLAQNLFLHPQWLSHS